MRSFGLLHIKQIPQQTFPFKKYKNIEFHLTKLQKAINMEIRNNNLCIYYLGV